MRKSWISRKKKNENQRRPEGTPFRDSKLTDFKRIDNLSYIIQEGDCLEKEKEFLELIEETREDFRKGREAFHKILPSLWRKLLEGSAENFPEEKFKELIREAKLGMAEAREKVTEIWEENLERLFSLIGKQFQEPIKPKEIEKKTLALIDLLKDATQFIIEELKAIDIAEAELDRVSQK